MFRKKDGEFKISREEKYLNKRGLKNLDTNVNELVANIIGDMAGNGLFKASMIFSFAKAEEQAKVTYLSAITEQNWILIKQNDEILKELKRNNK
ncbi:hypothetical protein [Vagococcus salmoninarum]|uniref:hypothetical protein n=1 Tax=Vagococcus salmoninarum TaxID=2739 RepID=UPI0028D4A501|nr:hypothetical protein [Vagococcus salmoninarum]